MSSQVSRRSLFLMAVVLVVPFLSVATPRALAAEWPSQVARFSAAQPVAGSSFGNAVALSGDTIVVGAPDTGPGRAVVFERVGSQVVQRAVLTASDGADGDTFGFSVAIDGDTIAVGASNAGGQSRGVVYVYTKPASGWTDATQTARLTAGNGADSDQLGRAVAVSADTVAAGAIGADGGQYRGAVYVFTRSGANWTDATQTAELTASDVAVNDQLGSSVSIDGTTIVAGSPNADAGGEDRGAAYVFTRQGAAWADASETAKLSYGPGTDFERMGYSVDVSGDTVVVGLGGPSGPGGLTNRGAVNVFTRPGGGWVTSTAAARLTASDATNNTAVGQAVSVSGKIIVAGASGALIGGVSSGAVYMFERPGSGWADGTQTKKLVASPVVGGEYVGSSVAIQGEWIATGATGAQAAYLFGPPAPTIGAVSPSSGSTFGGTSISVTGTGFRPATSVTVGGVPCSLLTVPSTTQLRCRTRGHAPGPVNVVVVNPDGQRATRARAFTYVTPTVALQVSARTKRIPVGTAKGLVTGVTTNATGLRITASCQINGTTLSAGRAQRRCGLSVSAARRTVTAKPKCGRGMVVQATVSASRPGWRQATWTRSWRTVGRPPCR